MISIKLKKLSIGILLVIFIVTALLCLYAFFNKRDINEPLVDQLSNCQEVKSSYIGLIESSAINKANKEDRPYRIVARDGVGFPVTDDYSPSRLNFQISNGLVEKVNCG